MTSTSSLLYDTARPAPLMEAPAWFVGRQSEYRQLQKAVQQARQRHPRSLLVTGDLGLGKSTLLKALRDQMPITQVGWFSLDLATCDTKAGLVPWLLAAIEKTVEQCYRHHEDLLNTSSQALGIQWVPDTVAHAINLALATASTGPISARETLLKALRDSIDPACLTGDKSQDALEQVVLLLQSPWLVWAHRMQQDPPACLATLKTLTQTTFSTEQAGELVRELMALMQWTDASLGVSDSAAVWAVDHWDIIADWPEEERLQAQDFLSQWLQAVNELRNSHSLILVTARNESLSQTLGGPVSSAFRSRILLSPWSMEERLAWLTLHQPQPPELALPAIVNETLAEWSQGNPFWLGLSQRLVLEHWQQGLLTLPSVGQLQPTALSLLGFEQREELTQWLMSRLLLPFLDREALLCQVVTALLEQVTTRPFAVEDCLEPLIEQTGQKAEFLFEVLRHLFILGILTEAPRGLTHQTPSYQVASRPLLSVILHWLSRRYPRSAQANPASPVSLSIEHLVPLSLQTGELSPEKLQAVLALGQRLGQTHLVEGIERSLLATLEDEQASLSAQLTALTNLAHLRSLATWQALWDGLSHPERSALYRETCARSLYGWLSSTHTLPDASLSARELFEQLANRWQEETDPVCQALLLCLMEQLQQAYDLPLSEDLLDRVQPLLQRRHLAPPLRRALLALTSPLLAQAQGSDWLPYFIQALSDTNPDVQATALSALTRQSDEPSVSVALGQLIANPNTEAPVRLKAIEGLAYANQFNLLANQLPALLQDEILPALDENFWLAGLRVLSNDTHGHTESFLRQWIQQTQATGQLNAVLLWRWIRTIGQVARTPESLTQLQHLSAMMLENEYLTAACQIACLNIESRIQGLPAPKPTLRSAAPMEVAQTPVPPMRTVVSPASSEPASGEVTTADESPAKADPVSIPAQEDLFPAEPTWNEIPSPQPGKPPMPVIIDAAFEAYYANPSSPSSVDNSSEPLTPLAVEQNGLYRFVRRILSWVGIAPPQLPGAQSPVGLLPDQTRTRRRG